MNNHNRFSSSLWEIHFPGHFPSYEEEVRFCCHSPTYTYLPLCQSYLVLIGIQNYVLGVIESTSYKDTLIFTLGVTVEGIEKSSASIYNSSFVCSHILVLFFLLFMFALLKNIENTMGNNRQDQRFLGISSVGLCEHLCFVIFT